MDLNVSVTGDVDLNQVVTGEVMWHNPETEEEYTREKTLGDLVAEKLADQLFTKMSRDDFRSIRAIVQESREKIIREKIEPHITAALSGSVRLTNQFGEPTGKEVTITELIVEEAKKSLTATGPRLNSKETLLAQVIREQVGRALTKELMEAVAEAKGTIVAAVRQKAAEALSDAVLSNAAKTIVR